ncbi:MAG: hypothetical protein MI922_01710 [Bacteroidales bacterium]|nr:hypothetical protein [Bacteroidales bacterium]
MKYRDLEMVRAIVKEAVDLEITYAYDDMVFPNHTAFIIRFSDEKPQNFFCHFHEDCNDIDKIEIYNKLQHASEKRGCNIKQEKSFTLKQLEEQIQIIFN